jgi:hypothetical protein
MKIDMPAREIRALQAVFQTAAEVDWEAYDRAKRFILSLAVPTPQTPRRRDTSEPATT